MNWKWNGSRWWKFDFHTHTPASDDYGKGPNQSVLKSRTPKEWLLDYMRAGIDCFAITDHNTGGWIDQLKAGLAILEKEKPKEFRKLYLFPGIELSVHGGIHVLAIFDLSMTTSKMDVLRGEVGYKGSPGKSDGITQKTIIEVIDCIEKAGGIAIPAHVDKEHGLFTEQSGKTLEQYLKCEHLFAMELINPFYTKPQIYQDMKLHWTELLSSDSHHPSGENDQHFPGSHFTWIKMGEPSLEGLKLALMDGPLSVKRSDQTTHDPNRHAPLVIESIEVSDACYMGRSKPFLVRFNPWLNTIIGGRGTGKSTLIEFLRLSMRRENEIRDSSLDSSLKEEFEKYSQVYKDREDSGLLTDKTEIKVYYRKDSGRFRIQWSPNGSSEAIEEEIQGIWKRAEGDIRQRFPIRIYSQKQIFQLAKTPLSLLRVVDDAPEVDCPTLRKRFEAKESEYLSLRAKIREIEAGLADEARLKGELEDVKRKMTVFEQSGHAETLRMLQLRRRQQRAVEEWETDITNIGNHLRAIVEEITPEMLNEDTFDAIRMEDADLLANAKQLRERLNKIAAQVKDLSDEAERALAEWQLYKDTSAWKRAVDEATRAYNELTERLKSVEAVDPSEYGLLVQRRQVIEQNLKDLMNRKYQIEDLQLQATSVLDQAAEIRRAITKTRREFLEKTLQNNPYIRITVTPYGATETVEDDFRQLLHREKVVFEKDIGKPDGEGLLGELYKNKVNADAIESSLSALKEKLRRIATEPLKAVEVGKRFADHLSKLPPEALDRIDLWFPEDSLDVQYCSSIDQQAFRPIQEGSPGQKTAALLAFFLSYGKEPLVLDQPEDDLDNHLIYDLIVAQLREVKWHRQVIVVTHNANIVVNGDAELVIPLAARGGETKADCVGSLQEKNVRDTICAIMEGGREAFEQRYRRITLERRRV